MFLIRALSAMPLWLLYRVSDILFLFGFYVIRYRRKLIRKNLRNSFPEKSTPELKKIERDFFKNLCDYAVELLKLLTISSGELSLRVTFKNPEIMQDFQRKKQSVVYLASHQFNWEWLLASGSISLPLNVDFVYQPVKNKFFDKVSRHARSRFGAYPIKRNEVGRVTLKRKDILRGIAIVGDQYPGHKKDKKYITKFLNQETAFFYGISQLAALTQYPVLYLAIKKVKRGFYEVTIVPITSPPYLKNESIVIEKYKNAVEDLIKENPAGWLWSHDRWKKRHLKYPENLIMAKALKGSDET